MEHEQQKYPALLQKITDKDPNFQVETYKHSDKTNRIITKNKKIVVPPALQRKAVEWYHEHLLHPGKTRMELILGQHYYFKGMRDVIKQVYWSCLTC